MTRCAPPFSVAPLLVAAVLLLLAAPAFAQRQPNSVFWRAEPTRTGGFALLVPEGWLLAASPTAVQGDAPASPAFSASADSAGRVGLRLLPGCAGNGPVDAVGLLVKSVVPALRPSAYDLRAVEQRRLPGFVRGGDAAVVTIEYDEGGTPFRERLFTVVAGEATPGGAWRSDTVLALRAPTAEWARWEPVFSLMLATAAPRTGPFAPEARDALQLALPGKNSWTNPFGGDAEPGAFHFGRYRWETPAGDVVFSFNETFNPNAGSLLGHDDWRKSKPL